MLDVGNAGTAANRPLQTTVLQPLPQLPYCAYDEKLVAALSNL